MSTNNDPAKAAAEQAAKEAAVKAKVENEKAEKEAVEKAAKAKENALEKKYRPIVEKYAPHYPNSKAFHFCSDSQIFLEGDIADAQAHQNQVDPKKEVVTINV